MKITRNQLRQLIQEEARSLSEDLSSAETPRFSELHNKIAQDIIALANLILNKWKPGSARYTQITFAATERCPQ